MQNIRLLQNTLAELCDAEHYLFSSADLESLFPEMNRNSLKALLSRAGKDGFIKRVCRGIYLFRQVVYSEGYELFHTASRLRAGHFNYISLETALSDEGVISQMPINRITIMSTGRKSVIDCYNFGKIEFIHTKKKLSDIESRLKYDTRCRMWRADKALAYEDLKAVGRNIDLINYGVLNDLV
jgi:predicted transcriptional regulator of viral defense system